MTICKFTTSASEHQLEGCEAFQVEEADEDEWTQQAGNSS